MKVDQAGDDIVILQTSRKLKGTNSKTARARVRLFCTALLIIATNTSANLQVNRARDDKVAQEKSALKMTIKLEITQRQHKLEFWFFCTALHIIATNTNAKLQLNWTKDDKVMLRTKNLILLTRLGDPIIRPIFDGRIKRTKC